MKFTPAELKLAKQIRAIIQPKMIRIYPTIRKLEWADVSPLNQTAWLLNARWIIKDRKRHSPKHTT